ncbi:MAG TPA: FAD:protein FMN transferase [Hanamia sp.]|nr:FAD:protein FMN transferase [Hanamia sp.]
MKFTNPGFRWMIIGIIGLLSFNICQAQSLKKFSFTQSKMGSPFTITLYGADSAKAVTTTHRAFALVDSLIMIFSDYEESSELNRLSASAGLEKWVSVSPALFDILQLSKEASIKSEGMFDITIGPVVKLWRVSRKEKKLPVDSSLRQSLALVGHQYILLNTTLKKVKLLKPGMRLDLGGIAKGYIAQEVVDFLNAAGITYALADAGGDLAMSAPPPGKQGWTIAINAPESKNNMAGKMLSLKNQAVATSGDVYQYLFFKGKKYSHIIDPRTGLGSTQQRNVTVIAASGAQADWLASACSLLPIRKAMRVIRQQRGTALQIMEMKRGKIKTWQSRHFKKYLLAEKIATNY